jgi:hypothetical protein
MLGVLIALAVSISLAAQSAQELYQRGLVQEHARGDLKEAMALYAQAAKNAGKDRALAAKALIRLAGSQEKLGEDAQAEKTYAELVRAYPEQKTEMTVAQQRLKALRKAASVPPPPIEQVPDAELAGRLARFLWNAVPDAALLDSARKGELRDPVALERQVLRMLRDRRSIGLVDDFFAPWLALDRVTAARPDPVLYPQVDTALLEAMVTETRLFVQSQLREDRDAVELWTAPYTYVNERLARHYGLSGIRGGDFRRVTWPDQNRAGLLGQAGPLTTFSYPSRTNPTGRGIYVLRRFLGDEPAAPPANIPPLPEGSAGGTMRDRLIAHRTNPACASCHAMFDPFGLALENFDAVGRWRTTDGDLPIDASDIYADTRFNGPVELRAALLKYRLAYYTNVTQLLLSHALNRKGRARRVYDYEMPVVRKIVRDASETGYRWSAILAGIGASDPFQAKQMVP